MSNQEADPPFDVLGPGEVCTDVEVLAPRAVPLGGIRAMTVHRTLPQRERSLVGSWCFLDHYGPDDVAATGGMVVPRHPHTGLATVSWIFTGRIHHLDSNGVAAEVLPGELNLMLAGSGITHQEISSEDTTVLHGVQLWYALPDATRFSAKDFAHYRPEPVSFPGGEARVFIGSLLGSTSPVQTRTAELLGVEFVLAPNAQVEFATREDFEYAALAESGNIRVNDTLVEHRQLGYVPPGSRTMRLTAGPEATRIILLGGIPFDEQIVMWWNLVGRSHDEIEEFRRRYQAELGFETEDPRDRGKPALFGPYPEGQLPPLPAPKMPNVRLRARS
ncbi:pirin family protein [Actinomyces minihominis]|uniref:pirin family protein n=1 Tax=Actinomyces minihominis TaxID=2002838 RepID=UPI000C07FF53|nr:pirin family protein [Actinomyces minihominis]